jgi:hypothetical protein
MKLSVTKDVSKETYELGVALGAMVKEIKKALSDGWQPGQDLPVVFAAIIGNMAQMVEGVQSAKKEQAADPEAFVLACSMALAEVINALK